MATKHPLKELNEWLNAYSKLNGEPDYKTIKSKVLEMIKEGKDNVSSKSNKIYFKDCCYSDYLQLRNKLASDEKFRKEYRGVDLQAYIDQALVWSEKGNTTTELGWLLTLKNWIRNAKQEGRMIMKPVEEKKGFKNL